METPTNSLSADKLEHFQWLNSPMTRKLIRVIKANEHSDDRTAQNGIYDPAFTERLLCIYQARRWTANKILETISTLSDVEDVAS